MSNKCTLKPWNTQRLVSGSCLVLVCYPVDPRIHFNPNNRTGWRKLKSNFKSIQVEIWLQYNSSILTWGVVPKKNPCPAVPIAPGYGISSQEAPAEAHVPYLCWASSQQLQTQGSSQYQQEPQMCQRDPTAACWQEASFHEAKELVENYRFTSQKGRRILFPWPWHMTQELPSQNIVLLTYFRLVDSWNRLKKFGHQEVSVCLSLVCSSARDKRNSNTSLIFLQIYPYHRLYKLGTREKRFRMNMQF